MSSGPEMKHDTAGPDLDGESNMVAGTNGASVPFIGGTEPRAPRPGDALLARVKAADEKNGAILESDIAAMVRLPPAECADIIDALAKLGAKPAILRQRLKEARPASEKTGKRPGGVARVPLDAGTGDLTELANSERLLVLHGPRLRFSAGLGWLAWDGQRWAADAARATELAKDALRCLFREAMAELDVAGSARDRDAIEAAEARINHAVKSQSSRGVAAMLKLTETDPRIIVRPDDLDADPYLLNVANGTIDLRTGRLRPHDSRDLITKLSPVKYDPSAPLDDWLSFLSTATRGDASMIEFLQRSAGYSLTGETTQEKLFFLSGPAGSSKSTFVDALRGVLGEYAVVTSFDTFVQRSHVEAQRPDLARLMGARMVSAAEVGAEKKLDEGVLSNATGGDKINACHKYKDPFDFKPKFKLWLLANKRPRVNDMEDETGIWRRLLCLPFDFKIPKEQRDPKVKARLTDPSIGGPAVLRWAVEGAVRYLREGRLVEPTRIEQATEDYRAENDPIRDFVAENFILAPGDRDAWILKSKVLARYGEWSKSEGIRFPLDAKGVTKRLREKPYECLEGKRRPNARENPAPVWFYMRERSIEDDAADEAREAREAPDPAEDFDRGA
jgi:putative DNA primase/helicase